MASFSAAEVVQATGARVVRAGSQAFGAVCTDTRKLTPGCLFVALRGERFDAHEFLAQAVAGGAAGVLVDRPVGALDAAVFQVDDTLAALGALARFHRERFSLPVVAVTGSNGKTTTKELVAAILSTRGPALKTQGNLNNEVGVPLTLFGLEPAHVAAVIELGMNHAGEIARLTAMAKPDAGLITIVQPAHLEGLGSIEGVAAAKGELFHGLAPGATAVVNLDDARIAAQAEGLQTRRLTWGQHPDAEVRLAGVEPRGREGQRLRIAVRGEVHAVSLRLVGAHNALNAVGAFALALAVGYSPAECVRGLEAAESHARRLQVLDAPGGVTVIDDCYNANPASMEAALRTLSSLAAGGRAVAVLGDMLELGAEEADAHARIARLAGELAPLVALVGLRMQRAGGPLQSFEDVEPLLTWLRPRLEAGDWVLVKASRGMKLERVVNALTGAH